MEESDKRFLDRFLIPIIIMLVALAAFGLGRLSSLEGGQGELIIQPPEEL